MTGRINTTSCWRITLSKKFRTNKSITSTKPKSIIYLLVLVNLDNQTSLKSNTMFRSFKIFRIKQKEIIQTMNQVNI